MHPGGARGETGRPNGRTASCTLPADRPAPQRHRSPSRRAWRWLLDDEPALAIRVLTDPRGQVQSGTVAFVEELLRRDIEEFGLVTLVERDALAYALVRLVQLFLYVDVLAGRKPDVDPAVPPPAGLPSKALCLNTRGQALARAWPARPGPWPRARLRPGGHRAAATGREQRDAQALMMPPKQTQYQVFHCPAVWAAAVQSPPRRGPSGREHPLTPDSAVSSAGAGP